MAEPLRLMLVDDEAPARARLRDLLSDIATELPTEIVVEARDGVEALERIQETGIDLALIDIRMPRMDGLQLALHLGRLPEPPAIVFITAFDQYAIKAFELAAIDYLLKPVRGQRLLEALHRVRRGQPEMAALQSIAPEGRRHLRATERGRTTLVAIEDVLYLKAGQKYVTVRTIEAEHLIEDSLAQLETEFGERFVRVHRNCLVARAAISGCERAVPDGEEEPHWQLVLRGVKDRMPVSRRQWPIVKTLIRS